MSVFVPDLKPLSAGQILDRAIRLYRKNFLSFLGIIAFAQIPLAVLAITLNVAALSAPDLIIEASVIITITSAVLIQVSTAAMTRAVADNYLGNMITIVGAYRKIGRAWWTLLGATFLAGILAGLIAVLFIIPVCGWIFAIPGLGAVVFLSMVVIPLIAPIVVLERQRATKAIYRAWQLARRRFWWLFGFFMLLIFFNLLVVQGPLALLTTIILVVLEPQLSEGALTALQQVIQTLLNIIYLPLQLTCITLLYFDVRVRTEGFDLAVLAASNDEAPLDSDQEVMWAPEPESAFEFTSTEVGYFCLISLGIGGIILVFSLLGASAASLFTRLN